MDAQSRSALPRRVAWVAVAASSFRKLLLQAVMGLASIDGHSPKPLGAAARFRVGRLLLREATWPRCSPVKGKVPAGVCVSRVIPACLARRS